MASPRMNEDPENTLEKKLSSQHQTFFTHVSVWKFCSLPLVTDCAKNAGDVAQTYDIPTGPTGLTGGSLEAGLTFELPPCDFFCAWETWQYVDAS